MNQVPEFIKPPTDIIYKFLAISGLILLILSFTIPYFLNRDLSIQIIQTEGDVDKLAKEIGYLEDDIALDDTTTSLSMKQVQFSRERYRQLDLKNMEATTKNNLLIYYTDELNNSQKFKWIGVSIGLILFVTGFVLWYFKLRRYQDLLIRNEAQKLKEIT